ncbi:hypothetical protein S40293_08334 [Stachybotrys chartarum IBT 40293]|nr:hypothetical protein S40293_08334 [Stachybotrys chartarum IBT 40293]
MPSVHTRVSLSDGAKLSVWVFGGDAPDKPLLIAVHGAPGLSSHIEPEQGYSFLSDRFRVLVFDLRGSGSSDLKGPYSDERWIEDIDELRAWAGAETFVLAGGSYGGFLALGYALKYPIRLSGLILRDTWACGPRGVLRALAAVLLSKRISPDPKRQVRLWSGNVPNKQDGEDGLAEILRIYTPEKASGEEAPLSFEGSSPEYELHWEAHNAAFSQSQPRFDVRSRLGEIKTHTLVLVGRHDVICPVEESEEISRGIPNNQLVVFEHSGHNPASDEPEAFQNTVASFLQSLDI